jgi:hypothetical protein
MAQENSFTCEIEDFEIHDRFSANVKVVANDSSSRAAGQRIELANIYITPISGQLATYLSRESRQKKPVTFPQAITKEKTGVHNHFVPFDYTGHGLYIVRDQYRNEVHRPRPGLHSCWIALYTFRRRSLVQGAYRVPASAVHLL